MPYMLSRPAGDFDTASGLLLPEHFQMAYVTSDMDAALDLFSRRLGIREFRHIGGALADGGTIDTALAWVGTVMYEIMAASGPGSDLYTGRLPNGDGFRMKHHHLGYLLHDQAQWDGVMQQAAHHGWHVPYQNSNPLVRVCFVDVPELGHYCEYLLPTAAGVDFFNAVPRH